MSDNVNHPSHYNTGKIEVIEFIEDQNLPYHLGSVVKYVSRAGRKDPAKYIEDLKKAAWYLNRFIEIVSEKNPRRPNDMNVKTLNLNCICGHNQEAHAQSKGHCSVPLCPCARFEVEE